MRLTILSDIHLDINTKRKSKYFTKKLIEHLEEIGGDVLLITGDIAGSLTDIVNFLKRTVSLGVSEKIFVPGNHDLWVNQDSFDLSFSKYYEILPEIFSNFNWHYLPNNPIIMDNVGFIGSIGWYDYSLRNTVWDNKYNLEIYQSKVNPLNGLSWMDQYFIRFGEMDDYSVTQKFISEMKKDYSKIQNIKSSYDKLILATHMVPFRQFVKYRGIFEYDYFTAFFGSQNLGNFYFSLPNNIDKIAIFGQTHIPQIGKVTANLKGYCVPIGYPREYGQEKPLEKVFRNRIIQIEI